MLKHVETIWNKHTHTHTNPKAFNTQESRYNIFSKKSFKACKHHEAPTMRLNPRTPWAFRNVVTTQIWRTTIFERRRTRGIHWIHMNTWNLARPGCEWKRPHKGIYDMTLSDQNQTLPATTAPNSSKTKKQFQVALLSQHQIVLSAQIAPDIFSARAPTMGGGSAAKELVSSLGGWYRRSHGSHLQLQSIPRCRRQSLPKTVCLSSKHPSFKFQSQVANIGKPNKAPPKQLQGKWAMHGHTAQHHQREMLLLERCVARLPPCMNSITRNRFEASCAVQDKRHRTSSARTKRSDPEPTRIIFIIIISYRIILLHCIVMWCHQSIALKVCWAVPLRPASLEGAHQPSTPSICLVQ